MNNVKTIICRDHHHFTEYITNAITEMPRRTPVDNGTDIYIDDIAISIRSPLHYHIITMTDDENTKIVLSPLYAKSNRFTDRLFEKYEEPLFTNKQSSVKKFENPNKLFTAKITADMDRFIQYVEKELRFMESRSQALLDYARNNLHILIREYNANPECNYLITYIKKSENTHFEINVVETNGFPKQSKEADKTPTKVKIEKLINEYYKSVDKN